MIHAMDVFSCIRNYGFLKLTAELRVINARNNVTCILCLLSIFPHDACEFSLAEITCLMVIYKKNKNLLGCCFEYKKNKNLEGYVLA